MALWEMASDFLLGYQYESRFDYVYNLNFDDPMGSSNGSFISLPSSKQFIEDKYVELLDEEILLIAVFHERIRGVRMVKHAFVVMQTANGAYSIDRLDDGTVLRRADEAETLLRYGPSGKRDGCKLASKVEKGNGTVADVVMMMHDEGLSSESYNLVFNNCQTTAWAVFDKFRVKAKSVAQKVKQSIRTGIFESFRRISRLVATSV